MRKGTKVDKLVLKKTFSVRGYRIIEFDDLNEQEIEQNVKKTAEKCANLDSFIVCVLSHGFDGDKQFPI